MQIGRQYLFLCGEVLASEPVSRPAGGVHRSPELFSGRYSDPSGSRITRVHGARPVRDHGRAASEQQWQD
jgi:hypothetical protein